MSENKKTERLNGLEAVLHRNDFYWFNYRYTVFSFLLLLFNILLLIGVIFYQRHAYPTPKYFGTTPNGRPILVVPLDEPYQSPESVLKWASNAVLDIYSIDFVNWRKSIQDTSIYFTQKGYWDFLVALQASTNLEAVKTLRQVVTGEITADPVLNRQGILPKTDVYSWDLQIPVVITYQNSAGNIIRQSGNVLMRVQRESTLREPSGLAIAQLVLQQS